jgi:hypothetical protein
LVIVQQEIREFCVNCSKIHPQEQTRDIFSSGKNSYRDQYCSHHPLMMTSSVSIESIASPGIFLRVDGYRNVVNCQYGRGPLTKFRLHKQSSGYYIIESVQYPGVFLRVTGDRKKPKIVCDRDECNISNKGQFIIQKVSDTTHPTGFVYTIALDFGSIIINSSLVDASNPVGGSVTYDEKSSSRFFITLQD